MTVHAARDHAQWSASSTERNWSCPGALALTDGLPETTSGAADWGTCAHQISEKCLRGGLQPAEFIGETEQGKTHSFEVDEEMAETAEMYVDYVRKTAIEAAADTMNPADLLQIEQKFSLMSLNPPFEAGGTGDAVIYHPFKKMLEVVDLKGGRGHVVEVVGNSQLRTYGLGAMLENKKLAVNTVKVTIIQPRAPHKDGRIRSEEFHVADLLEWTVDLLAKMGDAYCAQMEYLHLGDPEADRFGGSVAAWAAERLNAGDHCKFCKAKPTCPAVERKVMDTVEVWFDDLDQARISNTPDSMSPEKLSQSLDMLDMITEWVNAVRAYAHAQAEIGVEIPNYHLVEKIGNRKWSVSEETVIANLRALDVEDPFTRKLVSPAQAEKLLGAKKKSQIAQLIERPVTGTNLTRSDKTSRPAVASAAARHLEIYD